VRSGDIPKPRRVSASIRVPVHFRFLAHSLTTFGRWGCGERSDLSLDPVGIFFFFAVEQSVIAVRQGAVPYAGW
ncbi:hypothetical protein OFC21_23645, partial [Escherichia coli]|nr:hypothetical protein [Escherichia coli]